MSLRDVNIKVTDGGLGVSSVKGEGVHVKIGVSPIESPLVTITGMMGADKIKEKLGDSPLADACMDSVASGSNLIYCIPISGATSGTIGEVKKIGSGKGNCTVLGKPNNAYDMIIKILESGGFNQATFKYSINGGYSFSDEITISANGEFSIAETGLTITFSEDVEKSQSFIEEDEFTFSTTAPQMTNQDVLTALNKVRNINIHFEYIHIVGESTRSIWAALVVEANKFFNTYYKPLYFVLEARNKTKNEDLETYVQYLLDERKNINSYFIQVVTARVLYTRMDGTVKDVNGAGIVCGLYSRAKVQQSIGEVREFSMSRILNPISTGVLELTPTGIEDYIQTLDDAKYLTFREYIGIEGLFVTNARMMAQDGSDYQYAERVRVSNKLVRETRKEALLQLQSQVDMSDLDGSLKAIGEFIQTPSDRMVKAKEISSARVIIQEGQDILGTEKLDLKIRYVPVGHIREIEIDVGMENPFRK